MGILQNDKLLIAPQENFYFYISGFPGIIQYGERNVYKYTSSKEYQMILNTANPDFNKLMNQAILGDIMKLSGGLTGFLHGSQLPSIIDIFVQMNIYHIYTSRFFADFQLELREGRKNFEGYKYLQAYGFDITNDVIHEDIITLLFIAKIYAFYNGLATTLLGKFLAEKNSTDLEGLIAKNRELIITLTFLFLFQLMPGKLHIFTYFYNSLFYFGYEHQFIFARQYVLTNFKFRKSMNYKFFGEEGIFQNYDQGKYINYTAFSRGYRFFALKENEEILNTFKSKEIYDFVYETYTEPIIKGSFKIQDLIKEVYNNRNTIFSQYTFNLENIPSAFKKNDGSIIQSLEQLFKSLISPLIYNDEMGLYVYYTADDLIKYPNNIKGYAEVLYEFLVRAEDIHHTKAQKISKVNLSQELAKYIKNIDVYFKGFKLLIENPLPRGYGWGFGITGNIDANIYNYITQRELSYFGQLSLAILESFTFCFPYIRTEVFPRPITGIFSYYAGIYSGGSGFNMIDNIHSQLHAFRSLIFDAKYDFPFTQNKAKNFNENLVKRGVSTSYIWSNSPLCAEVSLGVLGIRGLYIMFKKYMEKIVKYLEKDKKDFIDKHQNEVQSAFIDGIDEYLKPKLEELKNATVEQILSSGSVLKKIN